jgi:hypothetical protein
MKFICSCLSSLLHAAQIILLKSLRHPVLAREVHIEVVTTDPLEGVENCRVQVQRKSGGNLMRFWVKPN